MAITGAATVNLHDTKHSLLVLTDDAADTFTENTVVINPVPDTANPGTTFLGLALWDKGGKPRRLPIRLTGKLTTASGSAIRKFSTPPPDAGNLTITLQTGTVTTTVTNIPVNYVNDDETP